MNEGEIKSELHATKHGLFYLLEHNVKSCSIQQNKNNMVFFHNKNILDNIQNDTDYS